MNSGETEGPDSGKARAIRPKPPLKVEEEKFYAALSHEIRRRIVKMVGNQENTFTAFKKALGTSTGTIYHHLDVLETFLYQDARKKYHLTALGKYAYDIMAHNIDRIEITATTAPTPSRWHRYFRVLPLQLFNYHEQNPTVGLGVTVVVVFLVGLLCAIFNVASNFLVFFTFTAEGGDPVAWRVWLFARPWFNFSVYALLVVAMSKAFFGSSTRKMRLFLTSMGYVQAPLLCYLSVRVVSALWMPAPAFVIFDKIVLIVFQAFSILLLTMSLNKFLLVKLEQGLILTLLVLYVNFSVTAVEVL